MTHIAEEVEQLANALAAHSGTPAEQGTLENIRAGVRRGAAETGLTPEQAALFEESLVERAQVRAIEIAGKLVGEGLAVFEEPQGRA